MCFRFELTSTESALILTCYDIGTIIVVVFVTYVGGYGHKPLWIGWGVFLVGVSGILFSIPHFVAAPHVITNTSRFFGNETVEDCTISTLKDFRLLDIALIYYTLNIRKEKDKFY